MKYIILASLLSTAAFAAPLAQKGQANTNAGATQKAGAGTANAQNGQAGQTGAAAGQATQQQGAAQGQTPANGQAAATGQNQNSPQQGAAAANGQTPSAGDLATAVSNWMADTSMVSNFLNNGGNIQNNVAFKQAATVAFNAEVDELNQKAVIDQVNSQQPNVIAANSTLATGGAFQDVVDKLQQMSVQGRAAVANIDLINQNRCVNVLPNIDAYMASTGDTKSAAVRPAACDNTGVIGGVQGQGPTQPGGAPGTPADAFAANQALVAGTGNGVVQPGSAAAGGAAQGATPAAGAQGATPAAGAAAGASSSAAQGQAGANGQQAQGQQAQGQQGGAANAQQGGAAAAGQQGGAAKGQQGGAANAQQGGAANAQQGGAANAQQGGAANAQQGGAANAQQGGAAAAGQQGGAAKGQAGAAAGKGKGKGNN